MKMKIKERSREVHVFDIFTMGFHNLGIGCKIISKMPVIPVSNNKEEAKPWQSPLSKFVVKKTTQRLMKQATVRPTVTLKLLQRTVTENEIKVHQIPI